MKNLQDILYKVNLVSVHGSLDKKMEAVVFEVNDEVEFFLFDGIIEDRKIGFAGFEFEVRENISFVEAFLELFNVFNWFDKALNFPVHS